MTLAYALKSPIVSTDPTLQTLYRDPLMTGALNDGVRFIFDLGFGFSYPGGALTGRAAPAAPLTNAVVADVAERANGRAVVRAGQAVSYAGGGFDFSALTASKSFVEAPASVAADIWTAYGGASQRFMVCVYFKLPAQADWNTDGVAAPLIGFGTGFAGAGVPDMISLAQCSGGTLQSLRQTAGSTLDVTSLTVPAGAYGQIGQAAFWRNAAGSGVTLKTGAIRTTATSGVLTNNSENFAAQVGSFGVGPTYWSDGLAGGHANAKKFRLYRGFVENLARSGRDPLTVLDADYARVVARAAFS